MSNIPASAVSGALVAAQASTHESALARKVQSQKNMHHSEEVNELEDTAVNSVGNESQEKGGGRQEGHTRKKAGDSVEVVEIESLNSGEGGGVEREEPLLPEMPQLDISA